MKIMTLQKVAKRCMPSNSKASGDRMWTWDRRGGYAGERSISTTLQRAKELGFQEQPSVDWSTTPDGSVSRRGTYLFHANGMLLYASAKYGAVAADNCFNIELHAPRRS